MGTRPENRPSSAGGRGKLLRSAGSDTGEVQGRRCTITKHNILHYRALAVLMRPIRVRARATRLKNQVSGRNTQHLPKLLAKPLKNGRQPCENGGSMRI